MPSGPAHWHEHWEDDGRAIKYLRSRGFVFDRGIIRPGPEVAIDVLDLAAIRLEMPEVRVSDRAQWRFQQTCAYYRAGYIAICPEACAHIGTAGRSWSYPGYVIDRTPYGVIQHEIGHYVDHATSDPSTREAYSGDFSRKIRQLSGEPKLTGYCPDDAEWFAEHFRLFVTNSDLLRLMRPRLFSLLRERFKPVIDTPWQEVLKGAQERNRLQVLKKIGQGSFI